MKGMSVQQRYDDIVRRTGISENVVRRVLSAERDSIVESLKNGERATLPGRASFTPVLASRLAIGGTQETYLRAKVKVADSILNELEKCTGFTEEQFEEDDGIKLNQISALM